MDGVEDSLDKCPDTLMSELVNTQGCPIENLENYHHFDIIYGFNFYQTNYETLEEADTISQSLQLDYYYKDFSLQANSSYYNSSSATYNDSGVNDSFIGASYSLNHSSSLQLLLSTGVIIPTYDSELNNNSIDYMSSLNLSYYYNDFNFFGGYSYTIINDEDILSEDISYQNTNAYNLGLGYDFSQNFYISSTLNSSESIYKNIEDIDILSIYLLYSIDENWFVNFTYAYGLSESASDNFASLRVGYYF